MQGEIKGANLVQNEKGQKAIIKLFQKYASKARMVYCNKRYVMAGKIFEYAIEPNLKSNLFAYKVQFNKYIATSIFEYFSNNGNKEEEILNLFHSHLNGKPMPKTIFDLNVNEIDHEILKWVIDIVQYKPETFYDEIMEGGEVATWILNLTSTCLMGLLSDWGKNNSSLKVVCDNSNVFKEPRILSAINSIGTNENRIQILDKKIGYSLIEEVKLGNSKDFQGLQIADLFASSLGFALKNKNLAFSRTILSAFVRNSICNPTYNIEPEYSLLQSKKKIELYTKIMKIVRDLQRGIDPTGQK